MRDSIYLIGLIALTIISDIFAFFMMYFGGMNGEMANIISLIFMTFFLVCYILDIFLLYPYPDFRTDIILPTISFFLPFVIIFGYLIVYFLL